MKTDQNPDTQADAELSGDLVPDAVHGFYLMRCEHDIARWQVPHGGEEHVWLTRRMQGYAVGPTNKPLFRRPGSEGALQTATHYLISELCCMARTGKRRFAAPLPDKKYDPKRYLAVDGNMLRSILAAMEKHSDICKAPETRGGRFLGRGRSEGISVTEWQVRRVLLAYLHFALAKADMLLPVIEMRRSWELLTAEEQEQFRDAWLTREHRNGRSGHCEDPVFVKELTPDGRPRKRKVGTHCRTTAAGDIAWPSEYDWKQRWKAADWHAPAAGRLMRDDEPGVAELRAYLVTLNRFAQLHCWRDGAGRVEPASRRMTHMVFRDERMDEHGRQYHPAQSVKKEELDAFTVDGEATVTGDIVCTHPTMLLGLAGRSIRDAPFDGDVYGYRARQDLKDPERLHASLRAVLGNRLMRPEDEAAFDALMSYEVLRLQHKLASSICLNAKSRDGAIAALARVNRDDPTMGQLCPAADLASPRDIMAKPFWSRERVEEVVDAAMADPFFGSSMCTRQGGRLMRLDSEWMLAVRLRLVAAGIPHRDRHDSITCPVSRKKEVDIIMKEEWIRLFGQEPSIKWTGLTAPVAHVVEVAQTGEQDGELPPRLLAGSPASTGTATESDGIRRFPWPRPRAGERALAKVLARARASRGTPETPERSRAYPWRRPRGDTEPVAAEPTRWPLARRASERA